MSDEDFEEEIRQDFLREAEGLLEQVEGAFMDLDSGSVSEDLLDEIFRLAHNFKGSAKAVGFESLSQFAHKFEDLLTKVKNKDIPPTPDVCSVLLLCNDALKDFVNGLAEDPSFTLDTEIVENKIQACLDQKPEGEAPKVEAPSPLEPLPMESGSLEVELPMSEEKLPPKPKEPRVSDKIAEKLKEEFLRVSSLKLDTMLNLVGELVVNQSVLANHRQQETTNSRHALETMSYMDSLVGELRDIALSLRMVPLKQLFQRMQRTARDLSRDQEKNVHLHLEGEHVELDKIVVDRIVDPLTHIMRNAVDHGIEGPEERVKNGKPEHASLYLKAEQKEDYVVIRIQEDGRGLSKEKILQKAWEKGMITDNEELTDAEVYSLIFRPGFSTAEVISDVSGRGVGMNVVKEVIEELKGTIDIETQEGKGTTFTISLPLSLSIISGMVVQVSERKYVIPLSQLVETIEYKKLKQETSTKGRMINLRGEVMPIRSLHKLLGSNPSESSGETKGVITVHEGAKVSFEVDEILGQQQIVIKKLGKEVTGLPGILAGAILADGEPGLILDLHDFMEQEKRYGVA